MKRKTARTDENTEESVAVAGDQLLTEGMWRREERGSSQAANMDLSALLRGTVRCRKGKPPSTKQTRKEAFDRYMKIIYGLPPNTQVDWEDASDPDTFSFHPEPNHNKPCDLPPSEEEACPASKLILPVIVEKKKSSRVVQRQSCGLTVQLQEERAPAPSSTPRILMKVRPRPAERSAPNNEEPLETLPPIKQPKTPPPPPPSPPPPPRSRTPTPLPPLEPPPEVPTFLRQFTDAGWFGDLFPDRRSIPSTLSPEDFALQLLGHLKTCSPASRIKIFTALQTLHSLGLLPNTDELYQGLIDLVPHVPPVEHSVELDEMLNLLTPLKSASYDLVKKLLTLLAFKSPLLRETAVCTLTALGVDEAEQWLGPELDGLDSGEPRDQSDIWKSLLDRADCWLRLWTSKYKEHNLHLEGEPSSFSAVDVLNYFCSVRKEERREARYVAPDGHQSTVLLPSYDCSSQPILRLGETYSMARARRPPGIILPPLRNRPFLAHFPNVISLPFARVTLLPFHVHSDEDWRRASPRRYFHQQQSLVKYYR